MDLGSGFQTSFVVAVLVGAVFLVKRLGGDEEVLRRAVQVAIAFALFLLVLASTAAFIRAPDIPSSALTGSSNNSSESQGYLTDAANKASGRGTVHVGVAILLVITGAALTRRHKVIPGGLLFGGVLLLLLGAPPSATSGDAFSSYYSFVLGNFGQADPAWDIVRLMVLGIGTAVLIAFAQVRWAEPAATLGGPTAVDPPGEPPPLSAE
jgi:hypothetical protein